MKKLTWTGLCRALLFFIFLSFSLSTCAQESYTKMRDKMVNDQLITRGISNPEVIRAMRNVERHLFVPSQLQSKAYRDGPLPIGYGQTISQPYVVAYMTEILELKKSDKVLEIGTGSGYQAAVLAEICDSVFSVEVVSELGEQAKKRLQDLGFSNVHVRIGDGYKGWKVHAPFDAIIVTCAPTKIPEALTRQLREGGRMIIPVGESYVQELVLLEKVKGKIRKKSVLSVLFVPMVDEAGRVY